MVRVRSTRNGLVRDHVNWCGILRPTHRSIRTVTSGRLGWRWRQLSTARDTATWRRIRQRQNSAGAESYADVSRRYAPAAREEVRPPRSAQSVPRAKCSRGKSSGPRHLSWHRVLQVLLSRETAGAPANSRAVSTPAAVPPWHIPGCDSGWWQRAGHMERIE